ncbi:MAG TPA: GNAT family N-acetyltransferase [Rhizomicrobium sp.]|nr:GNAT family N-acetyltransferase [Rhizomicrobium sp.]
MNNVVFRRAEPRDLPILLDIYNYYIVNTPITFDLEPKTLEQRKTWFETFAASGPYQCFVATGDGGVPIGWACSGQYKEKAAYQTSVELSVYVAPDRHRQGLGRKLYQMVIDGLLGEDIHRLYGRITEPNPSSAALHVAMGFRLVGIETEVGRKFGKFWNVATYERALTGA